MSNGALQNVLLLPHLVVGLQLVVTSDAASMKKKKERKKTVAKRCVLFAWIGKYILEQFH